LADFNFKLSTNNIACIFDSKKNLLAKTESSTQSNPERVQIHLHINTIFIHSFEAPSAFYSFRHSTGNCKNFKNGISLFHSLDLPFSHLSLTHTHTHTNRHFQQDQVLSHSVKKHPSLRYILENCAALELGQTGLQTFTALKYKDIKLFFLY
jgi:hypothetical protein